MSTINREERGVEKKSFTEQSDSESFLEAKRKNIREKFNPRENIEEQD